MAAVSIMAKGRCFLFLLTNYINVYANIMGGGGGYNAILSIS